MNHFLDNFKKCYADSARLTGGSEAGDQDIEQFLRAKPPLDGRPNWQPAPDVAEALETSISLVVADLFGSLRSQVHWPLRATESPIEGLFFLSLFTLAARKHMRIEHRENEFSDVAVLFDSISSYSGGYLRINVQPTIGEYRVDFLLEYSLVNGESSRSSVDTSRPALASFSEGSAHLIVECDGHEFHEKTKDQAEADKARDRTLQTVGYPVFRFTGSRLYREPFACARECLIALLSRGRNEPLDEACLLF